MPFNGSGTFNRTYPPGGWQGDAAANIKIRADRHDQHDADLASGLSNVICKDGQSSPTADIPFNNKKITSLADPINDQDAVTKKYMLGSASTQGLFTKIGFASADMSLLGRAAGSPAGTLQRIAYNDKADGTGNDVFVVNDDGTMSVRAADGTQKNYALATARDANKIVNGAFNVNQDAIPSTNIPGTYFVDQWTHDVAGASNILASQDGALFTKGGSPYKAKYVVTTGAAMGASDIFELTQPLEGSRTGEFMWGDPLAQQVVVRFMFQGPAGTYHLAISNDASNRSYVAPFTITAGQANIETVQVFIVPGDTVGAWTASPSARSMYFSVVLDAGANYIGVAGWQNGAKYSTPAQSHGSVTGNVFFIGDVGMYVDPDKTGIPPKWKLPNYDADFAECLRYYYISAPVAVVWYGYVSAGQPHATSVTFPTPMRIDPAYAEYNASVTNFPAGSMSSAVYSAGGYAWRTGLANGWGNFLNGFIANARM